VDERTERKKKRIEDRAQNVDEELLQNNLSRGCKQTKHSRRRESKTRACESRNKQ